MVVDAFTHAKFHDEVDMRPLINDLVQFHNVRVPQVGQSVDLSVHSHLGLFVLKVLFVVGLDSYHVLGIFVLSSSHDRKSSGSDLQVDLEISQIERLLVRILLSSVIDHVSEGFEPC